MEYTMAIINDVTHEVYKKYIGNLSGMYYKIEIYIWLL